MCRIPALLPLLLALSATAASAQTYVSGRSVVTERFRQGPTVTTTEEVTTREAVYYYAPVTYRYVLEPYFVVDHGPEYSGPGIFINRISWTNTDLQRSYPFIGRAKRYYAPRRGISALGAVPGVRKRWIRSETGKPAAQQTAARQSGAVR
jgi:hypothetical protein